MKTVYIFLVQILFMLFLSNIRTHAQDPTVGLIYDSGQATEGFTLFAPEFNNKTYLINNCGQIINEWEFSEKPGMTCYLLENGNLLRAGKDSLEIRDWENNLIWYYPMTVNDLYQHHDIEPLPNGNILCIVTERVSAEEALEMGRDPAFIDVNLRLDKIVEIEPVGTNDINIIWEWKLSDHYIQDYDITKPNYGVIPDHPELIDLNFDNDNAIDYTHFNGVDYNADLDQVLISCRHLSEIYIIDHSTTNAEVASHVGGNLNRGGDIAFRWGNPQVYDQGSDTDQMLFEQHDSKWISPGYLDEGKISVFINGDGTEIPQSKIAIIAPSFIENTYTIENNTYLPNDFFWQWGGEIHDEQLSETLKSGTQALPNGNFMICEYGKKRVSEITRSGTVLWTYLNPVGGDIFNQYETDFLNNGMFRGEKYLPDYPGFEGKVLTPISMIENENSLSNDCISVDVQENMSNPTAILINTLVSDNKLYLQNNITIESISIYGIEGKLYKTFKNIEGCDLEIDLNSGIYLFCSKIKGQIFCERFIVIQ